MSETKTTVSLLQGIITDLNQQADGHVIQSRIFSYQGLVKLAAKYASHAAEERGYVEQCINRILELGEVPQNEKKEATPSYTDAVDYLKYDETVSEKGLPELYQAMEYVRDDPITYDLLKDYYIDEVKDLDWIKQQLALISKIGPKNWYAAQME